MRLCFNFGLPGRLLQKTYSSSLHAFVLLNCMYVFLQDPVMYAFESLTMCGINSCGAGPNTSGYRMYHCGRGIPYMRSCKMCLSMTLRDGNTMNQRSSFYHGVTQGASEGAAQWACFSMYILQHAQVGGLPCPDDSIKELPEITDNR